MIKGFKFLGKQPPSPEDYTKGIFSIASREHFEGALKEAKDALNDWVETDYMLDKNSITLSKLVDKMRVSLGELKVNSASVEADAVDEVGLK